MKATSKRPELLAPAGDLEKLRFVYHYGADAAYVGCGDYSLRNGAAMSLAEIAAARAIADQAGKKLYVAVNLYAADDDFPALATCLEELAAIKPDALLVSDPGVFDLARTIAPGLPLHISTQASTTNAAAVRFWARQGASRVVLARELSLAQAAAISAQAEMETEVFVHGALCISYSGRCLISAYLNHRHANRGDCSAPCRWQYALNEASRAGEFFPIEEDSRGAYLLNSKDLCLLPLLPQLLAAGVDGWKIEGRNKSAYYAANTVRVYRAALEALLAEGEDYRPRPQWQAELDKVSHREYTCGFALDQPGEESCRYDDGGYLRGFDFAAIAWQQQPGRLLLEQRNHFAVGDQLELLLPDGRNISLPVSAIFDQEQQPLTAARHPRQMVSVPWQSGIVPDLPLICRRAAR